MATSGPDLLVASYLTLSDAEQEEAFERVHKLRVERLAGTDSETARYICSLRRVAEDVGRAPTVDDYKAAQARWTQAGKPIDSFTRVYRHFGSWPRAQEALVLSDVTTAKKIDARFRSRKIGKVWRYTEELLRETLLRAAEHWGRPPSTAEFEWWRDRELELAQANGDEHAHLPSTTPYRNRFKTWEGALLHFGFTPAQVAERLEGKVQPHNQNADPYLPEGLPVAELQSANGQELALGGERLDRMLAEWERLARRSRYVLTVRLGLAGGQKLNLRETAEPLGLHLATISRLQADAVGALSRAAAGGRRRRPNPAQLRGPVLETLTKLAVSPE